MLAASGLLAAELIAHAPCPRGLAWTADLKVLVPWPALEFFLAKSRPTLKDIAAALNVSHPTVSRALADHKGISPETKARIKEAAERLGYVANSSARMLRRGQSSVVGLLLPDITNEFYAAVAQRLADDCSARGRQLVLSISAGDPERELALVRALLEARPSCVIAAVTAQPKPETVAFLRDAYCVQIVLVNPEIEGPVVTIEDSSGARIAIDHLLGLGHRRIGFVGPSLDLPLGEARLRGLRQAMKSRRQIYDDAYLRLGPSTPDFGAAAAESLLAMPLAPTAIYFSTTPLSLGGALALRGRQVRIPKDLSVVVAGAAEWHSVWPGGLTSVSLPILQLADIASELAFRGPKRGRAKPAEAVQLSFELHQRASVSAPSGS